MPQQIFRDTKVLIASFALLAAGAVLAQKSSSEPGGEITVSPRSNTIASRSQVAYFEVTVKDSKGILVPNQEVRISLQPAHGGLMLKPLAISPGAAVGATTETWATATTDGAGVVGIVVEVDPASPDSIQNLLKLAANVTLKSSGGAQLPAKTVTAQLTVLPMHLPPKPDESVSEWQRLHDEQVKADFPWLAKFKEADMKLPAPAAGENRVVFMGDSITEGWHFDQAGWGFPGKPYINRGISGQTTPQMLVRFRQDVIALNPHVVVILAGINDIAGNTGPETLEQIEDNLASMADLAAANNIRVVLCSVLPAYDFPWHPGMEPAPKVVALNAWIKNLAATKGYVYVDYWTAMKDERGGLPLTLSYDGVHPLPAGYTIMAPLVEAGIQKALGK